MQVKIPVKIIELEPHNFHVIVQSLFSEGKPRNWVIDTGASKTVFDKNLENLFVLSNERDELHSAGINEKPIATEIGFIKNFRFGKLKVQELKVALLDLSHINNLYEKSANIKICGLLGGDFLMKHQAIIDYKKRRLILRK